MSLRICHAIPFFYPATRFGGPVTQLRAVCRLLAERGHRVRVVTTELGIGSDLPRERWIPVDGYEVWYARVGRLGHAAPYYTPRVSPVLNETLADTDVLHLGLALTHLNTIGRRLAGRHGVPYVYSPRSCLDPVRLRQRAIVKKGFLRLFENDVIRDAAIVHALTDAERAQVLACGARAEQIRVVPNLTLAGDLQWPDGGLFRRRFGFEDETPIVLFMGRLQSIKGLDLLVRCFADARRSAPSTQLVIAGPDEGGAAIVRDCARRLGVTGIEMTGPLEGELRLSAFRAADVFALTSYSEGMPNAVLEACAAGTAVLITDRCQLPEVARWGAGRVEPADDRCLAVALAEMLAEPDLRAEMGGRGCRMIETCFSPQSVMPRLENLYEEAAGRTPASSVIASVKDVEAAA